MKRLLVGIAVVLTTLVLPGSASAATDDFSINNYDIAYDLSKTATGASQLHTVETITAQFSVPNQNHGIERAIPRSYDNHRTGLRITSVTDQVGQQLHYTTYLSNDNLVLRIGDANQYVQGSKTYVITYDQQDVTRFYADTKRDEFYWDTNGTGWRVPIAQLSVSMQVSDAVLAQFSGSTSCYRGFQGSNNDCDLTQSGQNFTVTAQNLKVGENVSLALGFQPQTFAAYAPSRAERIATYFRISNAVTGALAIVGLLLLQAYYRRLTRRNKERRIIVNEFLPPKNTSIPVTAALVDNTKSAFAAVMLDFAVRRYLRIYETRPKRFLRAAQYDIEIAQDIAGLMAEEQEILRDIFGVTTVGQRLSLQSLRTNRTVTANLRDNPTKLKDLLRGGYGLQAKDPAAARRLRRWALLVFIFAIPTLSVALVCLAIIVCISSWFLYPLTERGLALARYLDGLKQYIGVAETDRLRALQSPEGALKLGTMNPNDPAQLVKLYERLLPYAVLFGQEKDWNKRIGLYYEQAGSTPDWYVGSNPVFNAAVFSSAVSSFSSAANYATAYSSPSGGSAGGGFSGGGGGGGGGGGW